MALCYDQQKITRKRDRETGLKTVSFKMGRTFQNCIDNVAYTLLNVELLCDRNKTGWCDCKGEYLLLFFVCSIGCLLCFIFFEWTPSHRMEVGIPLGILHHVQEQYKRSYFPRPGQS